MKRFIFTLALVFTNSLAFGQAADSIPASWELKCYPNPTSDLLIISSSIPIKETTFIDLNGQVLHLTDLPNNCYSLHDLPAGWIFVYIESADGRVEKKNIYKQ